MLKFVAQPLDCLRDQCGWHFVMEILPFQLLLLVLRWSHFHPEIVRACAKKLRRQTRLIPQARVWQELAELRERESKLWTGLYPNTDQQRQTESPEYSKQEQTPSLLCTMSQPQAESSKLTRLSECCLWDTQKQFYKDQGIRAWSSGAIPFGVSSSSFLAASYARVVVDFLLSNADHVKPSVKNNGRPNCFVWEAASGSCKFLHSFMSHFTDLVEDNDEFRRRGLVPLVVATDLSKQVLSSRRQMACFRPFIERGQLDFAIFDTHEFISGSSSKKTLELVHAGRQWRVGSDGPVALIGNYFLDSLRADVFAVAIQQDSPASIGSSSNGGSSSERVVIQAALLDSDTSSIADMDICLQPIEDPSTRAVYEDSRLNATLVQVLNQFRSRAGTEPVSSTGLVLFPVEAFEFFLTLFDRGSESEAFPIAVLAGDARFSFRDAISSAFITTKPAEDGSTEQISLELPQLSPHPDCFCLPVDFEIFKLFIEHLGRSNSDITASSELVSAPASDTFDVFFATIEPQKTADRSITNPLVASFKHQFSRFTPGDCDLLWGMMSFDDGARCFSTDTLLALLAQTGWDFDLFVVLKWELLNRLRRQEGNSSTEKKHYQQLVVEAGTKSWRTFYHMEQQSETDITTRGIRLQLARWFYGKTPHRIE
ncbi:hypothetical protein PHYSODRAFT_313491 [Phytophthora sojae]|uniref:Uncharacterized protein n=1 Tax=Phytophthora sojae (strain P6497) TaxID=1094619 RepID=G4ZA16_PHYSP|nr:hypothetical protein PHYSODRAFT_313491 [Phytophthora sojae]EGZ21155.1 hypothetical protein PHYSODRAFT_313491 [Phytophthora sojae]|eukprot:XP_009523872.1 hypothetical protein PHYSODRAFT_313491 [Phytophthora sojae]